MIKVVLDTNVIISGMIGHYNGSPRRVLNLALSKQILIYGCSGTFKEFSEKIKVPRLRKYLTKRLFTPEKMILDYKALVNVVEPPDLTKMPRISRDPDDDIYLYLAKAAGSKIVITGDKDLLVLTKHEDIRIVPAAKFLDSFMKLARK